MSNGIIEIFNQVPDPRKGNAIRYNLSEILVIAVLAILCGMEYFTEFELFAQEQENWLRKYLKMENGIPSHDTFGDVFAIIKPETVTNLFSEWVETVKEKIDGEVVPVDGKTIRASRDLPNNKKAIHVVSAWAAQNRLILGEIATDEKSNEITAIPQLLENLELSGCIVTIDAMGTQTKIAEKIIEKGADYVLSVKENQPRLLNDIELFFADEPKGLDFSKTEEKGHGRIEKRCCTICTDVGWIDPECRWKNLSGIAKITSETTILSTGVFEQSTQYFIFSRQNMTAAQVLAAKRAHWGIESMHWSLDVAFNEDMCRVRNGHAAEVFNVIRHFVLNLLNLEKSSKGGISSKRKRCAISSSYRETVLGFS